MEQEHQESKSGLITQVLAIAKKYTIGSDVTSVSIQLPESLESKQTVAEIFQSNTIRHLDFLAKANDMEDPVLRMMQVVWWFFASNPIPDVKKPLNPTLGEISQAKHVPFVRESSVKKFEVTSGLNNEEKSEKCELVNSNSAEEDCAWSLAEQVSHHPPITAYHTENKRHGVGINGYFQPKAKFTGTGVKLTFAGETNLTINKYNEVYSCTSPTVLFKIIRMSLEVVGDITITCDAHPYKAQLSFKEKPFLRGEANKVKGAIVDAEGQEVASFSGIWTKEVTMTDLRTNETYTFIQPHGGADITYPPFEKELENSARKVWQHVKQGSGGKAHKAKSEVEEEQRKRAKNRAEKGEQWEPVYFEKVHEGERTTYFLKKGVDLTF